MPALTGTTGGRNGKAPLPQQTGFYRRLLTQGVDFSALNTHVRSCTTPVNVGMVVNNACNLRCRHCYLQTPSLNDRILSDGEWEDLFASAILSDTVSLALTGKEIFLGSRGPALLAKLASLRRQLRPSKRIGVTTNGTLIAPHRELIEDADLTFLDISVDGLPDDHDAIRGSGAFEQMRPNLEWAAQTLQSRFFVSLTVQNQNRLRLNDAILNLNRMGVQNIGIGFFHPAIYNDGSLALTEKDHVRLFDGLEMLSTARLERPLTAFVEVDTLCPEALRAFLQSDWFSLNRIQIDRSRVPWIEYAYSNGFRMQFKFMPIPSAGHHSIRISPEGNVLASDDIFDTLCYEQRTLTTARQNGCDFSAMMGSAQRSFRTHQILEQYFTDVLPSLVEIVRAKRYEPMLGVA